LLSNDADVNLNFFGFTPEIMKTLQAKFEKFIDELGTANQIKTEFLLPVVVSDLIADGKANVKRLIGSNWLGFTYPEDKAIVVAEIKSLIKSGEYSSPLWK
jgi:hypothetical protein